MRAKVDAKEFVQALDKVSGLIRKSPIPALNGVLVQFEEGACTLTATNLESWLSVKVPAQGDSFACLLSRPRETARAFRQFDGDLVLEQTETGEGSKRRLKLALSCGPRSAELTAYPPEDFPKRPEWEPGHSFTANAAQLYARVERVKYAAAVPDPKHEASRSSIQFSESRIYTVDGYRLACDTDAALSVPVPFMAPPDVLTHLKLFGNRDVEIRLGDRYAMATDGAVLLMFRLPEGVLFQIDRAIPNRFLTEFYVSPAEFLGELAYLKQSLRGNGPFLVRFSDGALYSESGGERYATKIEADGCKSVTFGFNLAYMADAMEQFKKEQLVKMKFNGPMGPIVIEAEGRGDYALVLPVRLKENSQAA